MISLAVQLGSQAGMCDLSEQHHFDKFAIGVDKGAVVVSSRILHLIKEILAKSSVGEGGESLLRELCYKVLVKSFLAILNERRAFRLVTHGCDGGGG
jgi:hypothetical protein